MSSSPLSQIMGSSENGSHWPRWVTYAGIVLLLVFANTLRTILRRGLWRVPGPVVAKFSRFYIIQHTLQSDLHELFTTLHRKHGPLVRYAPNKVSVADPSAIPMIYGVTSKFTKSDFYRGFTAPHDGKIVDNIFATDDLAWHKSLKSAIAPMYTLTNLRKLESLVDECTLEFVRCVEEIDGKPVDLGLWLQWYAFDVISNITFAKTFGLLRDRVDKYNLIESLEAGNVYNTVIGQAPSLHSWLLANGPLMNFLMRFPEVAKRNPMATFSMMIEEARRTLGGEGKEDRGTHFEYLHKLRRNNPDRLSVGEEYSSIATNLFAGSDTTAMALRAIFYFLVKHPESYDKLRQEIDLAVKQGKLSPVVKFQEGSELTYLQAVIKESMRLHPGVSYPLERVVPSGGAEICGQYLPEGTVVGVHPWVVHRDPSIFGDDAERFRPERWLDSPEDQLKAMDRVFIPFGAGSRLCLGKHISMLEMTKFVPTILSRYDVEWASDSPEWKVTGYWFAKQSGVTAKLVPRTGVMTG